MKTEINNAHIIDPENNVNKITNLFIQDKTIAAVGDKPKDWQADKTIDAKDRYLFPGLIDLATRLREPGQEHKATIASETYAAVSGGITTVVCLPDTEPAINSPSRSRVNTTTH